MADPINLHIEGMDELHAAMRKFESESKRYMGAAGQESAEVIIDSPGLRKYPPAGPGNQPPTPYYIRGRGMQYANGNAMNSERYGTQFYTEQRDYQTKVGNRSSYAEYLAGEDTQLPYMAAIGWRKLIDVLRDKLPDIGRIYQAWIDKLIKDIGL